MFFFLFRILLFFLAPMSCFVGDVDRLTMRQSRIFRQCPGGPVESSFVSNVSFEQLLRLQSFTLLLFPSWVN